MPRRTTTKKTTTEKDNFPAIPTTPEEAEETLDASEEAEVVDGKVEAELEELKKAEEPITLHLIGREKTRYYPPKSVIYKDPVTGTFIEYTIKHGVDAPFPKPVAELFLDKYPDHIREVRKRG